jgi:hypothetical protein
MAPGRCLDLDHLVGLGWIDRGPERLTVVINLQWADWYYLGLLGFPVAVICCEQMLAVHRGPVERTFIALDIKAPSMS